MSRKSCTALAVASLIGLGAGTASADQVGKVGVDWIGNDIIIDAVADPQVKGVTLSLIHI